MDLKYFAILTNVLFATILCSRNLKASCESVTELLATHVLSPAGVEQPSPPRSQVAYERLQVINTLLAFNFHGRHVKNVTHIGEGGETNVYLVEFTEGTSVACRVPRLDSRPEIISRVIANFEIEADLFKSLQNANHEGFTFVLPILELVKIQVEGYDLPVQILPAVVRDSEPDTFNRYLSRYGKNGQLLENPIELLQIWRQMALAVQALHSLRDVAHPNGVAHLDIKPSNFLVTQIDGRVRVQLTDFGTHSLMDQQNHKGTFGSIQYFAPDRFYRPSARPAYDVYSLLVVYYATVLGEEPGMQFTTMNEVVLKRLPLSFQRILRLFPEAGQPNSNTDIRQLLQAIDHAIEHK